MGVYLECMAFEFILNINKNQENDEKPRNREKPLDFWGPFPPRRPRVAPRRPASQDLRFPAPCEAAQRAVPRTVGHNLDAGIGRIANVEICCRYTL